MLGLNQLGSLGFTPNLRYLFQGTDPIIVFTGGQIPEETVLGTNLGTLSVNHGSGNYTFSKVSDPDSKFNVSSTGEVTLAGVVS